MNLHSLIREALSQEEASNLEYLKNNWASTLEQDRVVRQTTPTVHPLIDLINKVQKDSDAEGKLKLVALLHQSPYKEDYFGAYGERSFEILMDFLTDIAEHDKTKKTTTQASL